MVTGEENVNENEANLEEALVELQNVVISKQADDGDEIENEDEEGKAEECFESSE